MGENDTDDGQEGTDSGETEPIRSGEDVPQDGERRAEETDGAGTVDATAATDELRQADLDEYWRRNVRLIAGLFAIWFAVSFLAAILLANPLQEVQIGTLPVPFWFAQQGSIIVFVLLILVYVRRMNKLDREFGVED